MSNEELQDVVDSLAARLGRSVAIDDPVLHLMVASHHFGDEDPVRVRSLLSREMPAANREFVMSHGVAQWTGAGRVRASPEFGAKARVCVPIRRRGQLLGYLWLIDDDRDLSAGELAEAERVARAAGLLLARAQDSKSRDRARDEAVLRDLFCDDPRRRARAQHSVHAELCTVPAPAIVVMVMDVDIAERSGDTTADLTAAIRSCTEAAGRAVALPWALCLIEGLRAVMLLTAPPGGQGPPHASFGAQIVIKVKEALGAQARCSIGVSSPAASLTDARDCWEQACTARRAAMLLPGLGPVVEWERLGVYSLLLHLVPADPSKTVYPPPVRRLLEDEGASGLLHTLETYLDEACSAPRTAALLAIHRTTLYYRLHRIEEVAAVDLDNGDDRLHLHLGVKLARLAGALPAP